MVNTRAGGDSPFLLQRVAGLSENLRAGVFPARWMADGAHGLGYPFYTFYAALPYYVAAVLDLAGLGVVAAIQATQVLGFFLAGLGAYGLSRRLGAGRPGALLAAAAYTYAPFHLVNVFVRGDALSEFFAMGLTPWILWAALTLCRRPTAGAFAGLAGGYALLVLTHNISALLFSPLLAVWLVALALGDRRAHPRRGLLLGFGAIGLGLLLSAWFWVPAIREQSLVQLQDQTTGYLHYPGHFRSADLVQANPLHDYSVDADRDPFSMGLAQALLAALALGVTAWRALAERRLPPHRAVLALALLGYTWLITPWSRVVWDHVPLLPFTQFPWRMLSVQALAIALLAADAATAPGPRWPALAAAALVAAAGMGALAVDRLPLTPADLTPERFTLYETYSGNIGTTIRHEYLPREMVPRPHAGPAQLTGGARPEPRAIEGEIRSATPLAHAPGREEWAVEVSGETLVAFQTAFYPGWQATVDGAPQEVQPLGGLGLVGVRLQEGAHRVAFHYAGTRTQRYAGWASVGGLAIWLGAAIYPARRSRRYRVRAGAGALALALGAAWLVVAPAGEAPAVAAGGKGPLVMDFVRAPYLHREPEGIYLGGAHLAGYTYGEGEPVPGEEWRITLAWGDAPAGYEPAGYEVEVALRGATAHLYEPAPTWAVARAPLAGPEQTLSLPLSEDLPPGLYVPVLRVLAGGEEQPVRTARGVGMGAPALAPLRVTALRPAAGNEEALGVYGPEQAPPVVALLEARVSRVEGNLAQVDLLWRSERQAPLHYVLSVRLDGPDGTRLAARDLPPLLGAYPTGLWRPGELVADRVLLPLPEGAPTEGLRLEVVLYDRRTLQGAGSVVVE